MKKYKVAFLGLKGLPTIRGTDRVVENIIINLDKTKFNITIYAMKGYVPQNYKSKSFKQIILNTIPVKNIDMFIYLFWSSVHALFKNYDLIHVHNIDGAFIIPILNLKYKNRLIATSHGSPQNRDKWNKYVKKYFIAMEKMFLRNSSVITSVSKPLFEYYKNKSQSAIFYIPNGINIEEKIEIEKIKIILNNFGVDKNFLLFASGRIIPTKGCHTFLNALKIIENKDGVVIAGDLSQTNDYKKRIEKLMNETNAFYVGLIKIKSELLGLISLAKYFIFPSEIEAMSMMLLEAASVMTPIICSNIPENTTIFGSEDVLFFNTSDEHDLARKLKWAISNPDKMKTKSLNAYNKVKENYLWSDITKRYENLYKKVLK